MLSEGDTKTESYTQKSSACSFFSLFHHLTLSSIQFCKLVRSRQLRALLSFDKLLIDSIWILWTFQNVFTFNIDFHMKFYLIKSSLYQNTKGYTISAPGWKQNVYGVAIDVSYQLWK